MLDTEKFIEEKVEWLRNKIGGEKAVAAVSGGVDSMTTAVLGHRAIGDRQIAVFLDDGLMREGEPAKVLKILKKIGVKAKIYEVSDNFFKALKGIPDPEEKRKAFRETFYRTLADVAGELRARFLLQGTIAADIVETAGGVKTQHNVLEQIGIRTLEKYGFEVLEPIKDLYKPQVRQVARTLGLPKEVFERRPFPGPGLSVRIIGEVTPERVEIVRKATEIVEEETKDIACFQAFAVLMNDRGTGITPDRKRKYGDIVVIRVVESEDAMKAKAVELPWEKLNKIKKRIIEDLPSVTHVLYDLTDKPPATIEFE
jgi:GMP synthase (glutamine-hydrolysing)